MYSLMLNQIQKCNKLNIKKTLLSLSQLKYPGFKTANQTAAAETVFLGLMDQENRKSKI